MRPKQQGKHRHHDVGALHAAGVEQVGKLDADCSDGADLDAGILSAGPGSLLLGAVAQQMGEKLCIFFYFQIILG